MTTQDLQVRALSASDATAVLAIYGEGLDTGQASFQSETPDWPAWDRGHRADCRLVATDGEEILGFAALSPTSARTVYAGVCEVSLYVARAARGRGVGRLLLAALIEASETAGVWTLQAGIFPENRASIALHETLGFRQVGRRERLGLMSHGPLAGRWRDVLLLERRSDRVG